MALGGRRIDIVTWMGRQTVQILAAGLAFVTALVSIAVLMRVLRHMSFMPFVIYRLFLGVVLLVLYYGFDWTLAI